MRRAGVEFRTPYGGRLRTAAGAGGLHPAGTPRPLVNRPPNNVTSGPHAIGRADEALDVLSRALRFGRRGR